MLRTSIPRADNVLALNAPALYCFAAHLIAAGARRASLRERSKSVVTISAPITDESWMKACDFQKGFAPSHAILIPKKKKTFLSSPRLNSYF